jgi:hypothetical protein
VYYLQTDSQSERTNQSVEIALCYYLATFCKEGAWLQSLPRLQFKLNNSVSATTGCTPNKAATGFTPNDPLDLLKSDTINIPSSCIEIADTIAIASVLAKHNYNTKKKPVFFEVGNNIYFTLYKGYSILSAKNKKLG